MKRKFAIRLVGTALLAAAAVAVGRFFNADPAQTAWILKVGLIFSLSAAALGNLIGGGKGALVGAMYGAALIMGRSGQKLFGESYGSLIGIIIISAPVALFAIWPRIFRRKPRARRGGPIPNAPAAISLSEALSACPANSLIAQSAGGIAYQLLRGNDHLYAVRLGPVQGPDPSMLISKAADFTPGNGSVSIAIGEIQMVKVAFGAWGRASLRIQTGSQVRRFTCLSPVGERDIRRLFDGAPLVFEKQRKAKPIWRRFASGKRAPYRRAANALAVPGILCAVVFLFAKCPYELFEALNLLFAVAGFLLYCAFFKTAQAMDKEVRASSAVYSCLPPVLALAMRALLDFNLDDPLQLIPPAAVLTLAATAVFLSFNLGARPILKRALTALGCAAILFAPAASVHLNFMLDGGANMTERPAVVEAMRISSDSRRPDHYILTLKAEDDPFDLRVAKPVYEELTPGDSVTVMTTVGALGVAYSDVYTEDIP